MLVMLFVCLLRSLSRGVLPLLILCVMPLPAVAGINDAVVIVEGCSGVCVDPRGIVLTARHCDHPEQVQIRFNDRVVPAHRVYVCPESEGAVAYDCEGEGFPCVPLAPLKPERGDVVDAYGYAGVPRRLVTRTGTVLGGAPLEFRGSAFHGNIVNLIAIPGMSGGPVVNSQGEVVGLVSASNRCDTACISWTSCRRALQGAASAPSRAHEEAKPSMLVFTTASCTACQRFKRDYAQNRSFAEAIDAAFAVELIDADERPDVAEQYGVTNVPAFIAPNGVRVNGYEGSEQLLIALGLIAEPATETETVTAASPAAEDAASQSPAAESDGIDRVAALAERAVGIATWLGVIGTTGGIGGAVLGGLALWRTVRRRRSAREPPASDASPKPTVITVDSAPPPQAIVPETRFAPYERDTYAEAFAWAEAEMARKYPGSVGTMESIKGLIDQYLSGKGIVRR